MSVFAIGSVTVDVSPEPEVLHASALQSGQEQDGLVQYGRLLTPDGFSGTAGVVTWQDGTVDVRFLDFISGADPYRRLERAGRMSVQVHDGRWVALLRALRHNGRDWPTLADVSWQELDELAGSSAEALLTRSDGSRVGTWGELNPAAARYRDTPAISCRENDAESLLIAYTLTRVMPIMKNFGLSTPKPFLQ